MRASALLAALLLIAASGAAPGAAPDAGGGPGDAGGRKTIEDSLLFSREELGRIEAARAGRTPAAIAGAVRSNPTPAAARIHLSAIVYHAPGDWRVWLNGESFTPGTRRGAIEILEVQADRVVLAWRPGPDAAPARVELRPNQTYVAASGAVLEGNP